MQGGGSPLRALPTSSNQEPFDFSTPVQLASLLPVQVPEPHLHPEPERTMEPPSMEPPMHPSTFKVKGYTGHSRHLVFPSTQEPEGKDYSEFEASLSWLLYPVQDKPGLPVKGLGKKVSPK